MSTSIVHVLTIIGQASIEVNADCQALLSKRVSRSPDSYGSEDWSAADHQEIDGLCKRLINSAYRLPVAYYAQYVDAWSVADSRWRLVLWPGHQKFHLCGASYNLVFYPSEHRDYYFKHIDAFRKSKAYQQQAEDRWYTDLLKEAMLAAEWLEAPFLVVSCSQAIDGSRTDDQIKAALELPLS
jgi:hypothetical protein